MCRVAVGAHGRNDQAALQEALSMNALSVMLDNVMLRSCVTDGGFLAFTVTLCAQLRHIDGICRRLLVAPIPHAVCAMTIGARRRIQIAAIGQLAVGTSGVDGICLRMAYAAVHARRNRGAWPLVHEGCRAGMTLRASHP